MSKPTYVIENDQHAMEQLAEWYNIAQQVKLLKDTEMALRTALSRYFFPNPKEGSNKIELPDGAKLVMQHKMSYKILPELMDTVRVQCKEQGINMDDYIKNKPELKLKEWRTLEGDDKEVFGQVLEIKPSSPSLEISV